MKNKNKKTIVEIYSKAFCVYCTHAKNLLDNKRVSYREIRVDLNEDKLDEMIKRCGKRTVPQIFINDENIGGFSELSQLERSGSLNTLLTYSRR